MNPERWEQIEKLYNSALEVESGRRESFLKDACAGDESLQKEVEQLLASQPRIDRLIESPALDVAARSRHPLVPLRAAMGPCPASVREK